MTLLPQTLRRLRHDAGFTTTALLTLGICIGANITIFAVVDAILVRSLPFPDADRLIVLHNAYPLAGAEKSNGSATNYYDRREAIKAFASISIQQNADVIVGDEERPARVAVGRVSPEFFRALGVPLAMGHTFTDAEMRTQLVGVGAFDAGVTVIAAAVMTIVVLVAVLLPSQRAARIQPLEALRQE